MIERFVAQRRPVWRRLESILDNVQSRGIRSLSEEDVEALGRLYRQVTSDLAIARRDYPQDRVTTYLNQLVARAHPHIYRKETLALRRIASFFLFGFPRAFRETWRYTAVALALFAVPALLAAITILVVPETAHALVPASVLRSVERNEMWTDIPAEIRSLASAFIMQNNIQVAILAFAGGLPLGLLTFYILVFNGLQIGAVAAVCQQHGLSLALWSFVLPHGIVELTVVFIAGGSGLLLGHALLSPGLFSRRDALILAGRKAVRLIVGCVPLLVVAGTIEGFVSPSSLHPAAKIAFGLGTGVLLYGYLLFSRREWFRAIFRRLRRLRWRMFSTPRPVPG